jgi:hypothetical protein
MNKLTLVLLLDTYFDFYFQKTFIDLESFLLTKKSIQCTPKLNFICSFIYLLLFYSQEGIPVYSDYLR